MAEGDIDGAINPSGEVELKINTCTEFGNQIASHAEAGDQNKTRSESDGRFKCSEEADTIKDNPPRDSETVQGGKFVSPRKLLPEQLYIALECCLNDEHAVVKRAASIALYVLQRPAAKVTDDFLR